MPYLFIIAIVAWVTYRVAVAFSSDDDPPGLITWAALLVRGCAFISMSVSYIFMDGPFDIAFLPTADAGGTLPFVLLINFFILIGPIGNAVFWGAFGLWFLKNVFDGEWYREALFEIEIAEETARKGQKKEQAEQREQRQRDWARGERHKRFERWGRAAGRAFGRMLGWR